MGTCTDGNVADCPTDDSDDSSVELERAAKRVRPSGVDDGGAMGVLAEAADAAQQRTTTEV